jgi:hypothetical protein
VFTTVPEKLNGRVSYFLREAGREILRVISVTVVHV